MIVFVNGRFVPEEEATVSIFDRAFLYGDGLFEAIRVISGKPFRWEAHLKRLQCGAKFLGIGIPHSENHLRSIADELIRQNALSEAILRITLSRGIGLRGYSPKGADRPSLVLSLHPTAEWFREAPIQWKIITSSQILASGDPLANYKTTSKLHQVLARAEAEERGANESLLLNTDGYVAEGASSNVFWIHGEAVKTSPLSAGILAGVTREIVVEICRHLEIRFEEELIAPAALVRAEGCFLTLTGMGVVEAVELNGQCLNRSPLVQRLFTAFNDLVAKETR